MSLPIFYNCLSNTKNASMRWLVQTKLGNKINVSYKAVTNCFKINSNSSFYQLFLICNFDLADVAERL